MERYTLLDEGRPTWMTDIDLRHPTHLGDAEPSGKLDVEDNESSP